MTRGPTKQELHIISRRSLVSPSLIAVLDSMLRDTRPGYVDSARAAIRSLHDGTLVGIQRSRERFWIPWNFHRAWPARADVGAIFQCIEARHPPRDETDLVGWIVVEDYYRGGALVLAHELGHFFHRWDIRQTLVERPPVVDALAADDPTTVAWVRARFVDEIAARHLAYLCEQGADPPRKPLPAQGALFGCAVKIASYPEIYQDTGVIRRLLACSDNDLLRDQVGLWFIGLRGLRFFEPGSERADAHARWLESEIEIAASGRKAPRVALEGTL